MMKNNKIKEAFQKLPKNIKFYIVTHCAATIILPVAVLLWSFSFSAAAAILGAGILIGAIFCFAECVRQKFVASRVRVAPIVFAIVIIVASAVSLFKQYNAVQSLSAVYSNVTHIDHSIELLKQQGGYKNISIKVNTGSFVETDYWVEKVITAQTSFDGNISQTDTSGIDSVISDRVVMYKYYVFSFDGRYFVAKISSENEKLLEQKGEITLNCLVSSPKGSDEQACSSICADIRNVLYSVDHFEGEDKNAFYTDLEEITGETAVMLTVENHNLFKERVALAVTFLSFVSGIAYILFMILYAPHMPPLPEKKKAPTENSEKKKATGENGEKKNKKS